ncbi:MAG: hypothetical protein E7Z73_11100 [Methanobrevibacter millerae]|uniref:Uncharacterized protein n=1 Tax=Methanobrevibacter millerae TaxID=230361 RepID=A0A8T3VPT5_9EURY|nr:hypothetical protein [Methanobrevibacter millerae]MBE6506254.1 hypothetical protein [Methanobrevibacter millerae]
MFDLSSAQNSVLFSQINEPNDDSFYLKFRKDYKKEDFSLLKDSIELLSDKFLNLFIKNDNGKIKQYYSNSYIANVQCMMYVMMKWKIS